MQTEKPDTLAAEILLVDDIADNLKLLRDTLAAERYRITVATNGPAALRRAAETAPDLILLDVQMPGMDGFEVCRRLKADQATQQIPVIFVTVRDENYNLVKGFQAGAVDYIAKPFDKAEVLMRVKTHLTIKTLTQELQEKNAQLAEEFARCKFEMEARKKADSQLEMISQREQSQWGIEGFVGHSATIQTILNDVQRVQDFDTVSVLITGESGTGKELIARAIHFGGPRTRGPFIPLNCSAIPAELAESTLFGHLKGAFTGASTDHKGCFELADGGTLFLDEIGDMPPALQTKLLRVLEDGRFVPVGGTDELAVDVRVVAATNAELPAQIECGIFRQDLFFRLARFRVEVPPLRQRRDDIPLLAQHFLDTFAVDMGLSQPSLSPQALERLLNYDFPGNVRELKNIIENALIRSPNADIYPQHLHFLTAGTTEAEKGKDRQILTERVVKRAQSHDSGADANSSTDEEKILSYLGEHDSINNSECCDLLSVEHTRASYLLQKMHRYGLLSCEGQRRWTRYRLT
ncbi:MAG: response regulator [Candidatus Latescibacteria bacterium]|nr:response regulator [Candidatus Latescibacterota bacterium]